MHVESFIFGEKVIQLTNCKAVFLQSARFLPVGI